jgi:hypothetical protein
MSEKNPTEESTPTQAQASRTYLGDGVYATYDGYSVVLTTENGIVVTNTIYLERFVFDALLMFARRLNEAGGW